MSLLLPQWCSWTLRISFFAIALSLFSPPQSFSKRAASAAASPKQIIFWDGFEPPGDGAPRDTSGAGSRDGGACAANEPAIHPLMPARNFGLTLAAHPTVFAQLPETSATQAVLVVTNEAGTYYERAFLPIPAGDVAAFPFPLAFAPLTVGDNYRWQLVIVCGETVEPDDPVLGGWMQRTEPPASQPQVSQPPIEQAQWYAQNGYWYEMLAILAKEARSHPSDAQLQSLWQAVLTDESQASAEL
ncbi:DUF928 domain-containing protein [cf. Phormidesmis sp. LEGE 11477]|uniref:DUF928 domain-containing protein n=1 Tax=cf. Phormidesmis sp. LEGE 11477 TaxID=1828680 RepID=UPI00187DE8A5|nr:DUF928 domain-containing protein [cf. Phormidesmis sp. LEGE 11477]MBE9064078.1 DUF928 domain-containing protein [cf. Phormidesmis sp. LEGE 11477]